MLIDSDNLIARIDKCYQESAKTGLGLEPVMAIRDIKALISVMPEVDAVPVVHGRWIMMNGMKPPEYHYHHQCSVCECYAPMRPPYGGREELSPWCPVCGAKMDLEEEEAAERHEKVVPVAYIDWMPTVDAVPVKHGHWEDVGSLSCRCSECGCKNDREARFCPNCGAKMDLEEQHENN